MILKSLAIAALLLVALGPVAAQPGRSPKQKTAGPSNDVSKEVTLTLVRWPFT